MRAAGLTLILLTVTTSLSSFYVRQDEPFVPPLVIREPRLKPLPYNLDPRYALWVIYYADETGVPVWMASRLFGQESVGDPESSYWDARAQSWVGALGLAQLMPTNLLLFARLFNDGYDIDPFDPETSIRVGLRYLADLYVTTGSWRMALMSYNGGLARWLYPKKYKGWMPETLEYVKAILGETTIGGRR